MNDTKNILIAWVSSLTSVIAALETRTWITMISAVILPIVFFTIGKAIDVYLQIYFRRRTEELRRERLERLNRHFKKERSKDDW